MREADLLSLVAGAPWAQVIKTPFSSRQEAKSEGFPETPEDTLALGSSLSEAPTLENTE